MTRKIALLAIGGNALLKEKERGLQEEQLENARETAEMLARVVAEGYALCVVHGNGPQVGNLLIQQEAGSGQIPPYSLDICGAMTQGSMGYMLERMLINRLRFMKLDAPVTSVLTEVVVDKEDKGFQDPTKPVGPFYPEFRALELMRSKRWKMKEDSGRGWRKVVPSPRPIRIVEANTIRRIAQGGDIVIAAGGGGVPRRLAARVGALRADSFRDGSILVFDVLETREAAGTMTVVLATSPAIPGNGCPS